MQAIPDSMMLLSCGKCGHTADFEEFCHTPIAGELPRGTHQCPACRKAWRMEKTSPGKWLNAELYIPRSTRAVTIPTIL
jgi:hypothetical protein